MVCLNNVMKSNFSWSDMPVHCAVIVLALSSHLANMLP